MKCNFFIYISGFCRLNSSLSVLFDMLLLTSVYRTILKCEEQVQIYNNSEIEQAGNNNQMEKDEKREDKTQYKLDSENGEIPPDKGEKTIENEQDQEAVTENKKSFTEKTNWEANEELFENTKTVCAINADGKVTARWADVVVDQGDENGEVTQDNGGSRQTTTRNNTTLTKNQ